jgi:LacI family transcriptional regulator
VPHRPTVREIARLAGVSVATVSRVSNGTGQVSPEMRRRVLAAIEQHGYQPDHLGRALAAGRHGALGLIFPGLSGPYFTELIQGFESETVPSRTSVHILCTHMREDSAVQAFEMARRVDGLVVIGGTLPEQALVELAATLPVVTVAGPAPGPVPSVRVENHDVMVRLTRHLLVDHGLVDLRFVGDRNGSPDVRARWQGFLLAHRQLGRPEPAAPVLVGLQQQDGVLAADLLLAGEDRPDGVVCANDETALGVLVGALGRRLAVPDDLVITGFDDAPMAALVSPGLTTVRQPVRRLAAEAAATVLRALDRAGSPSGPAGSAPSDLVLPTELVLRGSCGCPDQPTTAGGSLQ